MRLEGLFWYEFHGFVHVENVRQFLFFSRQNSGDERWEVVSVQLSVCELFSVLEFLAGQKIENLQSAKQIAQLKK